MVERRIKHETREPLASHDAARIAGALEIAGSAGFHVDNTNWVSAPFCQITDKTREALDGMKAVYGGIVKQRAQSWQWVVVGANAARIGEACYDLAPSRREMFALYSDWEKSDSHDERYEMGRELPTSYRSPVNTDDYVTLLKNPYFFAGIFDARGTPPVNQNGSSRIRTIASTNVQLLAALEKILGGRFNIRGGNKSFGRSMNLDVVSEKSIAFIDEVRGAYGVVSAARNLNGSLPSES